MSRVHFQLWYRLDTEDRYIAWYSNDLDGVVVDEAMCVPSFSSSGELKDFAYDAGIDIMDEEPLLHDLDVIQSWLSAKAAFPVDCDEFLAAWNLFGDISRSTQGNLQESLQI